MSTCINHLRVPESFKNEIAIGLICDTNLALETGLFLISGVDKNRTKAQKQVISGQNRGQERGMQQLPGHIRKIVSNKLLFQAWNCKGMKLLLGRWSNNICKG